jgi:hypothetical protein
MDSFANTESASVFARQPEMASSSADTHLVQSNGRAFCCETAPHLQSLCLQAQGCPSVHTEPDLIVERAPEQQGIEV